MVQDYFALKKPPKTDNPHNELTHHQRKHRKLARQHIFRNEAEAKYGIAVSKDDKAYIRPGISTTETFGSYCLNMGAGQSILFQNYFQTFQSLKMEILQNRK